MVDTVLQALGIPPRTRAVYQQLATLGSVSARALAERLGIPRPSVYDHLRLLLKNGLILERDQENTRVFQLEDPQALLQLVKDRIGVLQAQERIVADNLPALFPAQLADEPRVKFFRGAQGVRQALTNIFWQDASEICTMWPFQTMVDVLGTDFLEQFHRRRLRQHIRIRALWPADKVVKDTEPFPFFGTTPEHLRELRIAPAGVSWDMGHAIYGNNVSFIASPREVFGFIVRSQDFAKLMRAQFEIVWGVSTPLEANAASSRSFLRTVGQIPQ